MVGVERPTGGRRQVLGEAIADIRDDPPPTVGRIRLQGIEVAHPDKRHVLLHRREVEAGLATAQQAAASIDNPGLFAALSARPIGDDANHIDPPGQRDIQKFVLAAGGLGLSPLQDIIDVELDITAQRKIAA